MPGLCLERLPPQSKSKHKIAEWHERIIKCYEVSGDLTLVYLQEQDKIAMQQQNGISIINTNSTGDDSVSQHVIKRSLFLNSSVCSSGTNPQPPVCTAKHIGPILETALQRAPILHIQTGNVQAAVNRYRYVYVTYTTERRVKKSKRTATFSFIKLCCFFSLL